MEDLNPASTAVIAAAILKSTVLPNDNSESTTELNEEEK